jgi:hypothetical protein
MFPARLMSPRVGVNEAEDHDDIGQQRLMDTTHAFLESAGYHDKVWHTIGTCTGLLSIAVDGDDCCQSKTFQAVTPLTGN